MHARGQMKLFSARLPGPISMGFVVHSNGRALKRRNVYKHGLDGFSWKHSHLPRADRFVDSPNSPRFLAFLIAILDVSGTLRCSHGAFLEKQKSTCFQVYFLEALR